MSSLIKQLQEQRLNTWEQAKALLDSVESDKRDFTAEEDATWRKMNEDLDGIDARVQSIVEREQRNKDAEEMFRSLQERKPEQRTDRQDDALRSFLRGESRGYDVTRDVSFRDLTSKTEASGEATVPTSFYGQLLEHMIEVSGMLQAGPTVLETAGGNPLEIPVTTAHSTGTQTAENVALTESDPTFATRTLSSYKYGVLIQAPRELIEDTGVDLEGYLARQCGRAIGNSFGTDLITGAGGGAEPTGVVTSSTLGVTGGAGVTGAFTADNLIDLYYSVISPYRNSPSAVWMMRDASIAAVRKLKDTTNQYLWTPGFAGAPDTILGKRVVSDPNVAATALAAKAVLFGDFSAYFVRLVGGGVRFEQSRDYAFNTDQITFKATLRGDGVLADQTGAVKHFIGNAA